MPKFRKLVGTHYRKEDGKEMEYRPGSVIEATEAELRIHDPLMNTWRALDDEVVKTPEPIVEPEGLRVVKIEGTKEFNVINTATNEPINDVPLSRKDAFALVKNHKDESEEA